MCVFSRSASLTFLVDMKNILMLCLFSLYTTMILFGVESNFLQLKDGTVIEGVERIEPQPNGIKIFHINGMKYAKFHELTDDQILKYGLDSVTAENFEKKEDEKRIKFSNAQVARQEEKDRQIQTAKTKKAVETFTNEKAEPAANPQMARGRNQIMSNLDEKFRQAVTPNVQFITPDEQIRLSKDINSLKAKAINGDAISQFVLGNLYQLGQGVNMDFAESAKWSRMAAEQGVITAQFQIGSKYLYGNGVNKNVAEAVRWLTKAADQGDKGAKNVLDHLTKDQIIELRFQLQQEQINQLKQN